MTSAQLPNHLVERVGWSLVALALVTTGVSAWGDWSTWPGLAIVAPLVILAGLVGAAAAWTVRDPTARAWHYAGLAAGAAAVVSTVGAEIAARHYYSTDSAAFNDVATTLLLHGHNPYTSSLSGAARLLHEAAGYWTYLVNGAHVTQVSYPAGAFLLQAPLAAVGVHHLTTDWLDLAAWVSTMAILFRALPAPLRWLAPLLLLASSYAVDFANGGTDALFLPFLALAVWRWDRFVTPRGSRLYSWLSPVALGVACSIKQSPWFCVPFLVVAVFLEARAAGANPLRAATRYGAWVLGAFTLVDLPFIVWSPAAWWHGTTLPLVSPLVPDGQGLVTLALHGATGGVDLHRLWIAAALVLVAFLAALVVWYPRLKRAWPFLVPLVLFVPGRSLSSYLLDFFPIALVAGVTVARPGESAAPRTPRWRAALVGAPLVAAAGAAAWALSFAPLSVRVEHVDSTLGHSVFASVTVGVRNVTAGPVTPHFMVTFGGGHPAGFWDATVTRGHLPLAPGASATLVLRPPSFTWTPARDQYWLVTAYTSSPAAISTSPPRRWPYGPR